jgi:hypothetical protein
MGMSTAWATGPGFGNESVGRHCIARSGPPFPTAQAPLHPESLLNLTESGSLAESSPSATKQAPGPAMNAHFRFPRDAGHGPGGAGYASRHESESPGRRRSHCAAPPERSSRSRRGTLLLGHGWGSEPTRRPGPVSHGTRRLVTARSGSRGVVAASAITQELDKWLPHRAPGARATGDRVTVGQSWTIRHSVRS